MNTPDYSEIIKRFGVVAIDRHPFEACGLVYDNQLHVMKNIHQTPKCNFRIATSELFKAYQSTTGLQLMLHSHPHPYCLPSDEDFDLKGKQALITTNGLIVTNVHKWG